MACATPPAARMAAVVSSSEASVRAVTATSAPAALNASAMLRPMPRLAPVTSAFLPERSKREALRM
jgi:hypothetical protein